MYRYVGYQIETEYATCLSNLFLVMNVVIFFVDAICFRFDLCTESVTIPATDGMRFVL